MYMINSISFVNIVPLRIFRFMNPLPQNLIVRRAIAINLLAIKAIQLESFRGR